MTSRNNHILILTLLWMSILTPMAQARDRVVLATLDWEPYIGRNLKQQGYVAMIVTQAFKRSGMDVEIQFHQWSRVIGLAKQGKVDGYFPEYYSDAITDYASFSDPIPGGPLGFFKRTSSKISFTNIEKLKGYRIGVVKGYTNTKAFDMANFLIKHPVKDDLSNLRLLLAGRVDLVVADKYVGEHLVRIHLPSQASAIEFLPRILEEKALYVCLSKKSSRPHVYLNAFNNGLRQMKADRTLEKLLPQTLP